MKVLVIKDFIRDGKNIKTGETIDVEPITYFSYKDFLIRTTPRAVFK